MTQIIDPTDERTPLRRTLAARPATLRGTVALLDISKPRGDVLMDRLAARLAALLPAITFKRYRKPAYTRPAPDELRRKIADEAGYVIEALAD